MALEQELYEKDTVAQERTMALKVGSIDELRDRMIIVHTYWCLCVIMLTV